MKLKHEREATKPRPWLRATAALTSLACAAAFVSLERASEASAIAPNVVHVTPISESPPLVIGAGDSFTSGAGIGNYQDDTDVAGVNECARSEKSIADQVAADIGGVAVNIACARTTIDGMYRRHWNETSSQIDELDPHADVIVLTIGGNQARFASFLETCFKDDCDSSTPIYQKAYAVLSSPEFHDKLRQLYQDILARSPQAKVYVNGYEKIIRQHDICTIFGAANDDAISRLTDYINKIIQDTVTQINDERLVYMSPVDGDMCNHGPTLVTLPDLRSLVLGNGPGFPGHPTARANLLQANKIAADVFPPKP